LAVITPNSSKVKKLFKQYIKHKKTLYGTISRLQH